MKILASIYAESPDPDKRDKAKDFLKKVTQHDTHDIDSWIQLAEILEGVDLQGMNFGQIDRERIFCVLGSLDAYMIASKLIREFHGKDTPMEMLNNMGSLHYRLNNNEESRKCFEKGISYAEQAREAEPAYANSILVTMRYNLARVCEASFEFDKAETLYKEILREHPKYVDCVLRLGCMARDRGQIYSASDWFKDALEINHNSPDAWTMIGNLHAAKQEWRPGQKKFERILHNPQTANDSYALISLGNIWLQTLYMPTRDKERVSFI
jgi:RNA polymerase-associated protein CTR9